MTAAMRETLRAGGLGRVRTGTAQADSEPVLEADQGGARRRRCMHRGLAKVRAELAIRLHRAHRAEAEARRAAQRCGPLSPRRSRRQRAAPGRRGRELTPCRRSAANPPTRVRAARRSRPATKLRTPRQHPPRAKRRTEARGPRNRGRRGRYSDRCLARETRTPYRRSRKAATAGSHFRAEQEIRWGETGARRG